MATITLALKTKKQEFPTGTVGGAFAYWIKAEDGSVAVSPVKSVDTTVNVTLPDAADIDIVYTAYAQRLDADDTPIGPVAEAAFTLSATIVLLDVADTLTAEPAVVATPK